MVPPADKKAPNLPQRTVAHLRARALALRFAGPHFYIAVAAVCLLLIASVYTTLFFWPRTLTYSYAGETCSSVPTFLPSLHNVRQPDSYQLTPHEQVKIGNFPVIAGKTCATLIKPLATDTPQHANMRVFGTPLSQVLTIKGSALPQVSTKQSQPPLIAVNETLIYTLDKPDETFTYSLSSGDKNTNCITKEAQVSCNITPLNLAQGKHYELEVKRSLKATPAGSIFTHKVVTVEPLIATATSLPAASTVYDDPKQFTITFNKAIDKQGTVTIRSNGKDIPHTLAAKDSQLVATFSTPLPRSTSFEVSVNGTTATDKGYLTNAFTTSFTTSGGPKVTGVNIGQSRINTNPTIVLTFDTAINPTAIAQFISASNAGIGSISVKGNTATIKLARPLAACEALALHVSDKLQNSYGISGNNAWDYSSRAACGTAFSIGTSVEGRSVTAWQFGSGTSTVLYVGATHGNETSSKLVLDAWISYLDANAYKLPANRKIIVIPAVNPDGVAHNSRLNAHDVDLNRNFPANSWKANVTVPGGQLVQNGGGTAPLSEPESAILAAYTQSLSPKLVLTYHAKGSLVTANESGDSMALATIYGRKTGYGILAESNLGNTFNYDTTGAYENWLHDKIGIPTLLIELPGNTAQYFNSNQGAMWYMANS